MWGIDVLPNLSVEHLRDLFPRNLSRCLTGGKQYSQGRIPHRLRRRAVSVEEQLLIRRKTSASATGENVQHINSCVGYERQIGAVRGAIPRFVIDLGALLHTANGGELRLRAPQSLPLLFQSVKYAHTDTNKRLDGCTFVHHNHATH